MINEAAEAGYVDMDQQVERWRVLPFSENRNLIAVSDPISSVKMTEIGTWKDNEVFKEVEDKGGGTPKDNPLKNTGLSSVAYATMTSRRRLS